MGTGHLLEAFVFPRAHDQPRTKFPPRNCQCVVLHESLHKAILVRPHSVVSRHSEGVRKSSENQKHFTQRRKVAKVVKQTKEFSVAGPFAALRVSCYALASLREA